MLINTDAQTETNLSTKLPEFCVSSPIGGLKKLKFSLSQEE